MAPSSSSSSGGQLPAVGRRPNKATLSYSIVMPGLSTCHAGHEDTAAACHLCLCCLLTPPQVFELEPGVDSGAVWQEVCLLRRCTHERIVPLLGVAIKVSEAQLVPLALPLSSLAGSRSHLTVSLCSTWDASMSAAGSDLDSMHVYACPSACRGSFCWSQWSLCLAGTCGLRCSSQSCSKNFAGRPGGAMLARGTLLGP